MIFHSSLGRVLWQSGGMLLLFVALVKIGVKHFLLVRFLIAIGSLWAKCMSVFLLFR